MQLYTYILINALVSMQIYYTFPDCILQPAYLIENLFSIPLLIYLKTQNLILIEKNNSVKIIQKCILIEFGCHIIDATLFIYIFGSSLIPPGFFYQYLLHFH